MGKGMVGSRMEGYGATFRLFVEHWCGCFWSALTVIISLVSVGNFIVGWGMETMASSSLSVFLPIKEKYDEFAPTSKYLIMKLLESLP